MRASEMHVLDIFRRGEHAGIYQFVAVTLLPPFGFSRSEALAYIIVAQAITYAVVTVWGLLGLWRLGAQDIRAEDVSASN